MFLLIAAVVVVLVLWLIGVQRRPQLGFGILAGAAVGWAVVSYAPRLDPDHIPLWLPPLPFALVALALFFFGCLALFWGSDR